MIYRNFTRMIFIQNRKTRTCHFFFYFKSLCNKSYKCGFSCSDFSKQIYKTSVFCCLCKFFGKLCSFFKRITNFFITFTHKQLPCFFHVLLLHTKLYLRACINLPQYHPLLIEQARYLL